MKWLLMGLIGLMAIGVEPMPFLGSLMPTAIVASAFNSNMGQGTNSQGNTGSETGLPAMQWHQDPRFTHLNGDTYNPMPSAHHKAPNTH